MIMQTNLELEVGAAEARNGVSVGSSDLLGADVPYGEPTKAGEYPEQPDPMQAAERDGLESGRKYCRDIGDKFGTLVPTPKNPNEKGTGKYIYWKSGFEYAIAEWFST